jgi:ParB-like chromosome segregation protein Spo0J
MKDLKIATYETMLVCDLVPYARNARKHSAAQINKIVASIREFGFLAPVIIDANNGIVAGHGRILAAQKLKLTNVPCVRAAYLSEAQKRAYVLADNRLALESEWDEEMLALEFTDLKSEDFDSLLTGFDEKEIKKLLTACVEETKSLDKDVIASRFEILCELKDEKGQEALFDELTKRGVKCVML